MEGVFTRHSLVEIGSCFSAIFFTLVLPQNTDRWSFYYNSPDVHLCFPATKDTFCGARMEKDMLHVPVAVKVCTVLCRKNSLFPEDCGHCGIFPELNYIRWECKQLEDNEIKVLLWCLPSPLFRNSVLGCLIMGLFTLKYWFLPLPVFFSDFYHPHDETNTNYRRISERSLLARGSDSIQQ